MGRPLGKSHSYLPPRKDLFSLFIDNLMELGFGQKEDFDLQTLLERSPGSSSFEDIELSDISSEGTCEVLLESLA
jgi:hypothetical protein